MKREYRIGILAYKDKESAVKACISTDFYSINSGDFVDWVNVRYGFKEINGEYYSSYNILKFCKTDDSNNTDNLNIERIFSMYVTEQCKREYENGIESIEKAENGDKICIQDKVIHVVDITAVDEAREKIKKQKRQEQKQKAKDKKLEQEVEDILNA